MSFFCKRFLHQWPIYAYTNVWASRDYMYVAKAHNNVIKHVPVCMKISSQKQFDEHVL